MRPLIVRPVIIAALLLAAASASAAQDHMPPANPNYTPHPPKAGYSYPDCYCTGSDGERIEVGQTACLRIGSREVLARCGFSVNNPTWRPEAQSCPGV